MLNDFHPTDSMCILLFVLLTCGVKCHTMYDVNELKSDIIVGVLYCIVLNHVISCVDVAKS